MLENIFLTILDMSIAAGYCAIFVILIRLFIKKLPKSYSYVLWTVVFLRLILPSMPESDWSLLPGEGLPAMEQLLGEEVSRDEALVPDSDADTMNFENRQGDALLTGQPAEQVKQPENTSVQEPLNTQGIVNTGISANTQKVAETVTPLTVFSGAWLLVACAFVVYGMISSIIFEKRLKGARETEAGIYEQSGLPTAFVTGLIKPRIYLPADLPEEYRKYVLAHESVHVKRGDNLMKHITYFLTCLHWFNPLVWLSFYLMCKDMEMSCDERVLRSLGSEEKKAYSMALLSVASGRKLQLGMPIAFSESDAKSRIKNVLNYRKPTFWVAAFAAAAILAVAVGLLSNPSGGNELPDEGNATSEVATEVTTQTEPTATIVVAEDETWRSYLQDSTVAGNDLERWIDEVFIGYSEAGWFDEYNGEKLQRIPAYENGKEITSYYPATSPDIIFYQAEKGEDLQTIVKKMISTMIEPLMESSAERSYTITEYVLEGQPMLPIETKDMWLIKYLDGYHAYEGVQLYGNMEEAMEHVDTKEGMVPFERQGSGVAFNYILMELNGVYRLQRAQDMVDYKMVEVDFEEAPIYVSDLENLDTLTEKMSQDINLTFLFLEYAHANDINVDNFHEMLFEFVDKDHSQDTIRYYFDENRLYEAMARKGGQELSEFLKTHDIEKTGYGRLFDKPDGDAVPAQATVLSVEWTDGDNVEIIYSCHWEDYHYWDGKVVMREKDGEMIFVSNKREE